MMSWIRQIKEKYFTVSVKYSLRLVWAYKDVLRAHFPPVFSCYVRCFGKSQKKAAQSLRNKNCREVAFFLTIPGMWKSDYLFRALRDNPRYHPYVVIYPYSSYKGFSREEVDETLSRTELFIKNKGFEMTINSRNIITKDFTWSTAFTATWQLERIEKLPDGDLVNEGLFEGHPIKSIYDYKYAGIWGTNASQEELSTYGVKPGWVKIETVPVVNDDGTTDEGKHKYSDKQDRRVLGHQNPNWILGLNNTFTYKDFDLTIYAMARLGQTISSKLLGFYTAKSAITENQIAGVDYWTENNQGAYYPAPGSGDDQSIGISSLRIFDGSFFKIKNITFGYTLPSAITRQALIEKCRLYFTAYNPWIICAESQLKGTDPEMGGADAFPTYKQFVFGVNITF